MTAHGAALDHLVVLAPDLETGRAWMRSTLGAPPAGGGAHPLMGTHNALCALHGDGVPGAYLEVIARDPSAQPQRAAGLARWFDMDHTALAAQVRAGGPQLVHWVARVPDIAAACAALAARGIDRGPALAASRDTPAGRLAWRITVRDDGQRLFGGCLPTLIAWDGDAHPSRTLPASGVALRSLRLLHPDAPGLRAALDAIGLGGHPAILVQDAAAPGLQAVLDTPRGVCTLAG